MKIIYLLLLANFALSDTFKSWEANFEFSHHEFGKFKMKRSFEAVSYTHLKLPTKRIV